MNKVTADIWGYIFGFLGYKTLHICRSVSSEWKKMIDSNVLIWIFVIERHSSPNTIVGIKEQLLKIERADAMRFLKEKLLLFSIDFSFRWQKIDVEGPNRYRSKSITIFQDKESPWKGRFHYIKIFNWENDAKTTGGESKSVFSGSFSFEPSDMLCVGDMHYFPKTVNLKSEKVDIDDFEHDGSEESGTDRCDKIFVVEFHISRGKLVAKLEKEKFRGYDEFKHGKSRKLVRHTLPFVWDLADWVNRRKVALTTLPFYDSDEDSGS